MIWKNDFGKENMWKRKRMKEKQSKQDNLVNNRRLYNGLGLSAPLSF